MKKNLLVKKMSMIAMFAAIAYVVAMVAHFLHLTIVPSVSFLTYDPKDIIICIGGFILGPIAALIISVVVSFIEMITISSTGFYGLIMNIISTCAFVIPAALIYKTKKSFSGALIALLTGFISAIIVMTLWNIIITPLYMDVPRDVLIQNYLVYIIIFNLVKIGVNVALVLLLYKPIITALRAIHLIEKSGGTNKKTSLIMALIGIVLLIILIVIWILLKKFA